MWVNCWLTMYDIVIDYCTVVMCKISLECITILLFCIELQTPWARILIEDKDWYNIVVNGDKAIVTTSLFINCSLV